MKKKVVHITNDLQRLGGVQRLLVDMFTILHEQFEFEVILTRGENEYQEELEFLGVPVLHLKDIGLRACIRELNNADIVHAHLFPSSYVALLSNSIKVTTEHNPYYRRRDLPLVKSLESYFFRRFSKVICISEGVKSAFLKTLNCYSEDDVTVIYNGVKNARFSRLSKTVDSSKPFYKIGMVGRLVKQKDIETLIKAMSRLGRQFQLHLAGDGEMRPYLEGLVNEYDLKDRVLFYGQVNDIPSFLDDLDVYVQSSFWEGFGLAVVEAMAAGLPCLATNVDGLNDVVSEEYLFEVGDIDCLVKNILELFSNPVKYAESSRMSIDKSYEFTVEACAKKHADLYLSLLS